MNCCNTARFVLIAVVLIPHLAAAQDDGWTAMFNGIDLLGWTRLNLSLIHI